MDKSAQEGINQLGDLVEAMVLVVGLDEIEVDQGPPHDVQERVAWNSHALNAPEKMMGPVSRGRAREGKRGGLTANSASKHNYTYYTEASVDIT